MAGFHAEFVGSYPKLAQCPEPDRPEYAFCGRSNVGKSSFINALTGRHKLAKTSSTPGKTRLLNYFDIDKKWYLVDLPGYGFAKVSKKERAQLWKMINSYVTRRPNLISVFVLVDGMLPPQQVDLDFMAMLGENRIPFAIIFTKTDRITNRKFNENKAALEKKLLEEWEALPPVFVTSSKTGRGIEQVAQYIQNINETVAKDF